LSILLLGLDRIVRLNQQIETFWATVNRTRSATTP